MKKSTNPGVESYQHIIERLYDGLYCIGASGEITYWNKAAEQISGFSAAEVLGRCCSENILTCVNRVGICLCHGTCSLAATIADGKDREAEMFLQHKEGHRVPVLVRTCVLRDADGEVIGGAQLFRDVSNVETNTLSINELEKLNLLDDLTELPNRNYLERALQQRLGECKHLRISLGIILVNLDQFKQINDAYGQAIGDRVMIHVARSFLASSRPFDLCGRWEGDTFIGILRDINAASLMHFGDRLRRLVRHSYIMHQEKRLAVTISAGATIAEMRDTSESLLKRAEALLQTSKATGRDRLTLG